MNDTPAKIAHNKSRVLATARKFRYMLSRTLNAELKEAQETLERLEELCDEGEKFCERRTEAEIEDEDGDKEWTDGLEEARAVLRDVLGMSGRIGKYLGVEEAVETATVKFEEEEDRGSME